MRKIVRGNAPDILIEEQALTAGSKMPNWMVWGDEFKKKKEQNPSHTFSWKQFKNQKVNHHILPDLEKMADNHCHYCDDFPPVRGDQSIDHFKPKGNPAFYHLVYQWENLYQACKHCQDCKRELFEENLIRPDAPDYSFERYFTFKFRTFEIEILPGLTGEDLERATASIRIFGFNQSGKPTRRRHALERYNAQQNPFLVEYPFRFLFK